MSDDQSAGFFKGLLVGGAIGAIIALLYAPKSGKETREELSQKAEDLYGRLREEYQHSLENAQKSIETAQQKLDEISKTASQKTDEVSRSFEKIVEKGRKEVESQKGRLKNAMDAAKEAYAQEKTSKKKKA